MGALVFLRLFISWLIMWYFRILLLVEKGVRLRVTLVAAASVNRAMAWWWHRVLWGEAKLSRPSVSVTSIVLRCPHLWLELTQPSHTTLRSVQLSTLSITGFLSHLARPGPLLTTHSSMKSPFTPQSLGDDVPTRTQGNYHAEITPPNHFQRNFHRHP